MMRYEDYSFWSRCLPLVYWIRWTLCRIVEKETNLPDICCSKDRSEINFWKSQALGAALSWFFSILTHVNLSKSKHYSVKTFEKTSINFMFLVSPNDKRFYSYLGTSVGQSQMKILFTSYYQNIPFRNTVLSQKFQASFFLIMISC